LIEKTLIPPLVFNCPVNNAKDAAVSFGGAAAGFGKLTS
jgi:hypothetical protein